MRFRTIISFLLAAVLCQPLCAQEVKLPSAKDCPHPRLLMKDADIEAIHELVAADRYAKIVDSTIAAYCATHIADEFLSDEMDESGTRMRYGRMIGKNIFLFSYMGRVHGDAAAKSRAIEEMMRVCSWKSWAPEHFLDPSQMAFAVAVCYDWFYNDLDKKQRKKVENALMDLAVFPSFEKNPDHYFYSKTNWNSVCNCGIVSAAIAIMDVESAYAQKVMDRCVAGNGKVLASYGPEGAYPEGYAYWSYGTNHEVLLLDMLESVFGTDFGLILGNPGFMQTPYFVLHMNGPFGYGFNYGDNRPDMQFHPAVYWFASKRLDPSVFYMDNKQLLTGEDVTTGNYYILPSMMVWYSKLKSQPSVVPAQKIYTNSDPQIPLFIYRSSWEDPSAAYLGIRGGSVSKVNHSHIDVGSFVYYKDCVRWITELGAPNYAQAEKYIGHYPLFTIKQDARRWEVLREGAEGHSIATYDGLRPIINCDCKFLRRFTGNAQKGALIDLSSMYEGQVKQYRRFVYLDQEDNLILNESITGGEADRHVRWNLVTAAAPSISEDGSIVLSADGKTRTLTMTSATVQPVPYVAEAGTDNPWDEENPGMSFIGFEFDLRAGESVSLLTVLK